MTFDEVLSAAATASADAPLAVVTSACLLGDRVGWDGSSWPSELVLRICEHHSVAAHRFCPENHSLGTPRDFMNLHHGDGYAVLDGTARVITGDGADITEPFMKGAQAMVDLAARTHAVLGILNDASPTCGSNIVHVGEVPTRDYRAGPGVTTAGLRRLGVCVISQRDHRSLERLMAALDPSHAADPGAFDFVDDPWYRGYFGGGPPGE